MGRSRQQRRLVRCMRIELAALGQFGLHPPIWVRIFRRFWGDVPIHNEDPRWDVILHELKGLRLFAQYRSSLDGVDVDARSGYTSRWKEREYAAF